MRADAAWATPGFSGAAPSGPRSHPRRHDPAAPSAAPGRVPSQALSNAPSAAFIARPPPHPSHSYACEGPSARKTLRRPRRSKGYPYPDYYRVVAFTGVGMGSLYFSAEGGGFFRLAPSHASAVRGCGGGGCEKRCRMARFSGLAKEAQRAEASWADEGTTPSSDTGTPEKPGVARACEASTASHRD